jgi:hypothetical protein
VSRYRHKILLSIACFAVAGAVVPAAAGAHNREFPTTLTIKDKGARFKGRVKSDSDDCTKKRLVILYAQEAGQDPMEVGRDRSDENGRWKFEFVGNHYFAEVGEKVIKRGDHKHTCLFDRSPTTPFPMRAGEKAPTKLRMKMECKFGTCEKARRANTPGTFKGRVRSSNPDCVDGREVKIVRKGGPAPGPVDSTEANESGRWQIERDDLLEGTYRAKTGRAPGCKIGKSKKWTLAFM